MWQEDSEATNASSGSSRAGSFQGAGTTCGLGRRRDRRAAVERPLMRAAVLALGEVAVAGAGPADRGGVGAHSELCDVLNASSSSRRADKESTKSAQ